MEEKLNDEMLIKQQKLYISLKKVLIKALTKILSNEDKEDMTVGYLSLMALIRVAANIAITFKIEKDAFLFGCENMYKLEKVEVSGEFEEEAKKIDEKEIEVQNLKKNSLN